MIKTELFASAVCLVRVRDASIHIVSRILLLVVAPKFIDQIWNQKERECCQQKEKEAKPHVCCDSAVGLLHVATPLADAVLNVFPKHFFISLWLMLVSLASIAYVGEMVRTVKQLAPLNGPEHATIYCSLTENSPTRQLSSILKPRLGNFLRIFNALENLLLLIRESLLEFGAARHDCTPLINLEAVIFAIRTNVDIIIPVLRIELTLRLTIL